MKKLSFAIVGAAALALAACGGTSEDALGNNVDDANAATENLDAMAAEAANGSEADALANQAESLDAEGAKPETPADEADADAANVTAM